MLLSNYSKRKNKNIFFLFSLLILCSCEKTEKEKFVAKVGDNILTNKELVSSVDTFLQNKGKHIQSYVNHWVERELILQEAKKSGIENETFFREKVEEFKNNFLINSFLQKKIYSDTDTNFFEEDLQNYFNKHRKEFIAQDDIIFVSIVIFKEKKDANNFRNSILFGEKWEVMVSKILKNKNVRVKENIFFTRHSILSRDLWFSATSLKKNEITFPVSTDEGFVVLKSNDIQKKGIELSYDFAKSEIKNRLIMEKRRTNYSELILSLYKKYDVKINLDILK